MPNTSGDGECLTKDHESCACNIKVGICPLLDRSGSYLWETFGPYL